MSAPLNQCLSGPLTATTIMFGIVAISTVHNSCVGGHAGDSVGGILE